MSDVARPLGDEFMQKPIVKGSETEKKLKSRFSGLKSRSVTKAIKGLYDNEVKDAKNIGNEKKRKELEKMCFTAYRRIYTKIKEAKSAKKSKNLMDFFNENKNKVENLFLIDKNEAHRTACQNLKSLGVENFSIDKIEKVEKQALQYFANFENGGWKNNEDFFGWYVEQYTQNGGCCKYCKIHQDDLYELFEREIMDSKKFEAGFHIERKNDEDTYTRQNCVLVCCVCNNAKSDMIDEGEFKKYFVEGIIRFYAKKLGELKEKNAKLHIKTKSLDELLKSLK